MAKGFRVSTMERTASARVGYGWIIHEDHSGNAVGRCGPTNIDKEVKETLQKGLGIMFRMTDDDGRIVLVGKYLRTDGKRLIGLEPLEEIGLDRGCVKIEFNIRRGDSTRWEEV